jgi:hypothetical protein
MREAMVSASPWPSVAEIKHHVRATTLGSRKGLDAAVRGVDHPDFTLPMQQRPDAVARRKMIIHEQQIELAWAGCVVAVPANEGL